MSDDTFLACLLSDNDFSKDGLTQDSSTSPTKETNSCDKNGNFDVRNEEFIIDKVARRLSVSSVESFTENLVEEACKINTEEEIIPSKEAVVNNEVDIICNSEDVLKADNSKVKKTSNNNFFYINYIIFLDYNIFQKSSL